MPIFNHDLLLNPGDVERAHKLYPNTADFLDWPDLKKKFEPLNNKAGEQKRSSRRAGVVAVCLAVAALSLAAAEPLLQSLIGRRLEVVFVVAIVGLSLAGVLFGSSVLRGRPKDEWLHNRAASERLRQLHFQWLARNALRIATASERPALGAERDRLLTGLEGNLTFEKTPLVNTIMTDFGGRKAWLVEAQASPDPAAISSPVLTELFAALLELRIEHQEEYARKKLDDGYGLWPEQPKGQERQLGLSAFLLTVAIILLHVVLAILVSFFGEEAHRVGPWLQAIAMIAALIVLGVRVLEDGLRPKLEVTRYRRYQGELAAVQERFLAASAAGDKIAALEELEELSYRELRDFLIDHSEATFVM